MNKSKWFSVLVVSCMLTTMFSCSKYKTGDWVHFSSYKQYAILNNGDTITYEDGFVMCGMNSGATKRQLTAEEQQQLLNMLDTSYRMSVKGREPFEDLAIKWKRNYPGQSLSYMMKFQNHNIANKYSHLKVEDLKTIVCDYDSTYQKYIVDKDNGHRLYYTEFE